MILPDEHVVNANSKMRRLDYPVFVVNTLVRGPDKHVFAIDTHTVLPCELVFVVNAHVGDLMNMPLYVISDEDNTNETT